MMTQEQQIKCYGQTIDALKEERAEMKERHTSTEMYVTCILSDAQHVMAMGDLETARQYMNKAKWFLNKQDDEAREERFAKTGSAY